jgi:glycosyltransferase involved in cell wall biosynthesis
MENEVTFSIIISCLNEVGKINLCLDSILAQDYDLKKIEILIFDGGSTDNTLEILVKYQQSYPNIIVAPNPGRVPPAGWNLGWQTAKGKYLLLMGAHTVLPKDFLTLNERTLEEHPEAIAVGGKVLPGNNCVNQSQRLIGQALSSPFAIGGAAYRSSNKAGYVETLNYAAYRREAIESVGLFLPWLTRNDDWEYNYRITKLGFKLYFNPEIKSYYIPRTNLQGLARQQFRTADWKWEIIRLHPKSLLLRHLVPSVAILIGVVMILFKSWFLLLGLLILYILLALYFARSTKFIERIAKVLIFLTIHLSYGFGFIYGLLRQIMGKGYRP